MIARALHSCLLIWGIYRDWEYSNKGLGISGLSGMEAVVLFRECGMSRSHYPDWKKGFPDWKKGFQLMPMMLAAARWIGVGFPVDAHDAVRWAVRWEKGVGWKKGCPAYWPLGGELAKWLLARAHDSGRWAVESRKGCPADARDAGRQGWFGQMVSS